MKKFLLLTIWMVVFASQAFGQSYGTFDLWRSNDRTKIFTPPSATDTLAGLSSTQTFTNKTIDTATNTITNLTNTSIAASAGIDYSKLGSMATGQILLGNAGVPTATTLSGGATVGATGVVTLGNSAVITQLLTGYTSGAGTVSSADTIIGAIQKIDGNDQLKVLKSVATTAGDLYGSSASSTPARVPVGNDGDVLSGDSSQSNKWTTRQILESTNDLSQFNGYENLNTWATGNSAIVMGGGTLNGVFAKETADPLNLSATYKYTQGASALNDYMCTPAKPVKRGFKGPTVFVGTPFNYDGSNGDIQVSVYDVTNSVPLSTFSAVTFPSSSSSSTQMMSGVFPPSTNSYRICYQVKSANSGKIFSYGPIISTKSLAIFGSINSYNLTSYKEFTPNFSGIGTPSLVKAFWRQNGDHLEVYGRATSGTVANSGFTIGFSSLGLKIDTSKVVADNSKGQIKGAFARDAVDAGSFNVGFSSAYVDSVHVAEGGALGGLRDSDGSAIINSNEKFSFYFSVPILGWTAESPAIASPTQQVSSDTIPLSFKTSAIVDADPIGTIVTYTYASGGNTLSSPCGSAPTQTLQNMNANGIQIFARAWTASSTCASPSRADIKIGKGLKSYVALAYKNTAKTVPVDYSPIQPTSTVQQGTMIGYDEFTGVLTLDAGINNSPATTTATIGRAMTGASTTPGSAYFTFNASTTPSIASLPQLGNNYTPGLTQGQRVETFSFVFGGASATTVCSASPCTTYNKIGSSAVPAVTWGSAGQMTMTFTKTYSVINCSWGGGKGASAVLVAPFEAMSCSNCSSIPILTVNTSTQAYVNAYGSISCQGIY